MEEYFSVKNVVRIALVQISNQIVLIRIYYHYIIHTYLSVKVNFARKPERTKGEILGRI